MEATNIVRQGILSVQLKLLSLASTLALSPCGCARPQLPSNSKPPSVTIPGALIESTLIASDELFQQFEQPRRDEFGHYLPVGLHDDLERYDIEIEELPSAYIVELQIGAQLPRVVGGGGRWTIAKEDFHLLSAEHFE